MIVRTIFYIGEGCESEIERAYQDTTTLSMDKWIIQHNKNRGADFGGGCNEISGAVWESEDEFLVIEGDVDIKEKLE
jgi:hypothetical protein